MSGRQEYVRSHYDGTRFMSRSERAQSPLYELKKFHNSIKRNLLMAYAYRAGRLLDLCCGRGGDLQKWEACGVEYVLGVDISPRELEEARARYATSSRRVACIFECADLTKEYNALPEYNVVSAMFCVHYFFGDQQTAHTFLRTVSSSLKRGGYFIGCVPDGKAIEAYIDSKKQSDHLDIHALSTFHADQPFGREYVFSLSDTVTSSERSAGSVEYLVDMEVFEKLANEHGLRLQETVPFAPPTQFPGHVASTLFTTFVFVKT